MARTKASARKSTHGKCPRRGTGFHQRTRRGTAQRLYTPRLPNTFIVPVIDPNRTRGFHREPDVQSDYYEPLDGPNSDGSEEFSMAPSDSNQATSEATQTAVEATADESIIDDFNQERTESFEENL